jgi:hypothetical protein
MTGLEHYREAERLLRTVAEDDVLRKLPIGEFRAIAAVAQVHATLALAADAALREPHGRRP